MYSVKCLACTFQVSTTAVIRVGDANEMQSVIRPFSAKNNSHFACDHWSFGSKPNIKLVDHHPELQTEVRALSRCEAAQEEEATVAWLDMLQQVGNSNRKCKNARSAVLMGGGLWAARRVDWGHGYAASVQRRTSSHQIQI